jgi:NTP pyrophosphatase (non-canonical NTP hydrolase)
MAVKIGTVYTYDGAKDDRAQALKILEEAAEVFSAWESYYFAGLTPNGPNARLDARVSILEECADLITATCGLMEALGVKDAEPELEYCKARNEKRGRKMR